MKIIDKTLRNKTLSKSISIILLIVFAALACCIFVACVNIDDNDNDGNNSNNGDIVNNNNGDNANSNGNNVGNVGDNNDDNVNVQPPVNYCDLTGYVRDVDFNHVKANICYNNEVKCSSDENGNFSIKVVAENFDDITGKIGLEGPSLTYFWYTSDGPCMFIIKLEEGMDVSDFYFFAGKVVNDNDGETAVAGSSLVVNGTDVLTFDTNPNFDLWFVHKDSVILAVAEGYDLYNGDFRPITSVCFADALADVATTTSYVVNGEEASFKTVMGFTFRLRLQHQPS